MMRCLLSHRTQGQNIYLNLWGTQNTNDFISGLCSLLSLLINPPFPKTCCSEFYVLWSSVNQSSMITDSLYMGQLESLWHDFKIPKSIKLMWFETINPFFFPPPQAVSSLKWCQTDCKILGQVSWDHGLNVPSYKSDQGVEGHISSSTGQENRH